MKLLLLFVTLYFSTFYLSFGTTWIVKNSGNVFTPVSITIDLGDSVSFQITGTHDAREVSQETWNAKGNTHLTGGFQTPFSGGLVLPSQLTEGTHYYVCTPHAQYGMLGKIIVQNCNNPSNPNPIAGTTIICSGSTNTYSIPEIAGASSYTWSLPAGWIGISSSSSINANAGSTSGSISVYVNNDCGSSPLQSINISLIPLDISVSVSVSTLSANAIDAVYQWIDCNGNTPVTEQTTKDFSPIASGSYAVIITQNGCTDTSSCYNFNAVGIRERNSETGVTIFPNPSSGIIQLSFFGLPDFDTNTVEIYNMQGHLVYKCQVSGPKASIDLSNQKSGMYFIKTVTGKKMLTRKFVLQN